ncbi:hypothetical protein CCP3SC5AM1_100014 [Gammaproteobacteria bacterium]
MLTVGAEISSTTVFSSGVETEAGSGAGATAAFGPVSSMVVSAAAFSSTAVVAAGGGASGTSALAMATTSHSRHPKPHILLFSSFS